MPAFKFSVHGELLRSNTHRFPRTTMTSCNIWRPSHLCQRRIGTNIVSVQTGLFWFPPAEKFHCHRVFLTGLDVFAHRTLVAAATFGSIELEHILLTILCTLPAGGACTIASGSMSKNLRFLPIGPRRRRPPTNRFVFTATATHEFNDVRCARLLFSRACAYAEYR